MGMIPHFVGRRRVAEGSGVTVDGSRLTVGPVAGRVGAIRVAAVVLALLTLPLVARADPGAPPDGSFFRVTVDGGVSPFRTVAWDVTLRGKTVVVSLVKETLCLKGQRERVVLLDGDGAARLLAELEAAGAWSFAGPPEHDGIEARSRDRAPAPGGTRYEFWRAVGRRMTRFTVDSAGLGRLPAVLAAFTGLREAVQRRVEPLPMRDLYHPADKLGWLTMTATEPATATFDGWDAVKLPVDSLEMVDGEHSVVVVGTSGRQREFTVRIGAGSTSQVHVLLE